VSFHADLRLHLRYAMGVSMALDIAALARGAQAKGIDLLATGDFTHLIGQNEIRVALVPVGDPELFASCDGPDGPRFMLSTEISCVYQQDGRTHCMHMLVHPRASRTSGS
jgi:PHP family Zn ribbon phosphoesterase